MSFFYLFPLHALNKYLEINWKQVSMNDRAPVLKMYWRIFLSIAFVTALATLIIAWYAGTITFILIAVSYLFGGLYSIRIIPLAWRGNVKSIRDIPGSKDTMIASAWTFATVALPSIHFGGFPGLSAVVGGVFAFIIVFSRATILAIGGIESDKVFGLETIPILIGKSATLGLLYTINTLLALTLLLCSVVGLLASSSLIMLVPVFCMLLLIRTLSKKGQFFRLYHQVELDSIFFLTFLCAFIVLR